MSRLIALAYRDYATYSPRTVYEIREHRRWWLFGARYYELTQLDPCLIDYAPPGGLVDDWGYECVASQRATSPEPLIDLVPRDADWRVRP